MRLRAVAFLIFFASGFAALVYQIVWQRLLVIFSGSDIHSATIIVAAFMAGLGCGSLAGAQLADRLPRAANLVCFAVAELAIAAFGFFSASLYYDVLYQRLGRLPLSLEARAAILFISLLWPTFFMGVSLPLLARALTTTIGLAARVTGGLYACNTAGAAAGAFVSTWVLMPAFGLERTLQAAAIMNGLAAVGALPLVFRMRAREREAIDACQSSVATAVNGKQPRSTQREPISARAAPSAVAFAGAPAGTVAVPFAVWAAIYALAGFLALSLEIVWFRLLGVMLKSTSFTFGTLLSIYLTGIGLGAALGTVLVGRVRRPAHAFLAMQAAIGLYAGLAVTMLLALVANVPRLAWLQSYFDHYEPLDVSASVAALGRSLRGAGGLPEDFLVLYLVIPIALLGPPTLLMGASFPLLQKTVQTDLARLGRRVGGLLAANIAGSALGSIVTGWMLLAWLGTSGTLKLLVVASAVFPLLGMTWSSAKRWNLRRLATDGTAIGAATLLLAAVPDGHSLWARFHGSRPAFVVVGEDGSGISVLKTNARMQRQVTVYANGIGQSTIPYGGIHTILGALPAFLHPNPRDVAVIGLGSGDTLFGVAGRPDIERITCVEIVRPQLDTLTRLRETWAYPGLQAILSDPRISHVYGDGRLHLMLEDTQYDIIEADALRPTSAYAGHLYSDAYFALLRDRLKPGGLAVSWSPTSRVRDTFVKVFPHVLNYREILVGSNEPIAFDAAVIRQRLSHPDVQAYYGQSGVDILRDLAPYLGEAPRVFDPSFDRSDLDDINTDLFPKDELELGS